AYPRIRGAIFDGLQLRRWSRAAPVHLISLEAMSSAGDDLAADQPEAEASIDHKRTCERLGRAISTLPDRERHFIHACYFGGLSISDAGRQLGLSRSWSSRIHARAVDRLRVMLSEG
ncbi:MAG: sigma-70 family RNA polymerase sigma factor, partial [Myxococcota bacterium]